MDVGAWLRGLGLERYERAFRDDELTPEVLPELTDADLRSSGSPARAPQALALKAILRPGRSTGDSSVGRGGAGRDRAGHPGRSPPRPSGASSR